MKEREREEDVQAGKGKEREKEKKQKETQMENERKEKTGMAFSTLPPLHLSSLFPTLFHDPSLSLCLPLSQSILK